MFKDVFKPALPVFKQLHGEKTGKGAGRKGSGDTGTAPGAKQNYTLTFCHFYSFYFTFVPQF